MLERPERFFIPTANKKRVTATVTTRGPTKDFIKLKVGSETAIIPISSLYKMILVLANEDEQDAMVPTRQMVRRKFVKTIGLRIPKGLPEGELFYLEVPMEFDLPADAVPLE